MATAPGGAGGLVTPLLPPAAGGPLGTGIFHRVGKGQNLFQVPAPAVLALQGIPSASDPFPDFGSSSAGGAAIFIDGHFISPLFSDHLGPAPWAIHLEAGDPGLMGGSRPALRADAFSPQSGPGPHAARSSSAAASSSSSSAPASRGRSRSVSSGHFDLISKNRKS